MEKSFEEEDRINDWRNDRLAKELGVEGARRRDANNSGPTRPMRRRRMERTQTKFMRNVCDTREAWQRRRWPPKQLERVRGGRQPGEGRNGRRRGPFVGVAFQFP